MMRGRLRIPARGPHKLGKPTCAMCERTDSDSNSPSRSEISNNSRQRAGIYTSKAEFLVVWGIYARPAEFDLFRSANYRLGNSGPGSPNRFLPALVVTRIQRVGDSAARRSGASRKSGRVHWLRRRRCDLSLQRESPGPEYF